MAGAWIDCRRPSMAVTRGYCRAAGRALCSHVGYRLQAGERAKPNCITEIASVFGCV